MFLWLRFNRKNIITFPLENNIFEWHYIIKGIEYPYKKGIYYGTLIFPKEYPLKPPEIKIRTPNGRFEINKSICLSISSYHPESWNPTWTVETILIGLYSFMIEDTDTLGSIKTSNKEKKIFFL